MSADAQQIPTAEHAPPRRSDGKRRGRPLLRQPVVRVGPVPERARLGHRPGGLLGGRQRLGQLPARPRPLAGVPLERGRHGRHLRHPPRALPCARALERAGPDPQGADVRAHRAAGQPRRGRQGVLVVPRGAAEPRAAEVALPLPAGGVPVRAARPPRPRAARPRARAARHRRLRRRPLLVGRRHLRQGVADRGADADRAREPRAGRGDDRRAADAVVPQHLVVGRRARSGRGSQATARRSSSPTTRSPATGSRPRPGPTARSPRRSSARTRRTRRGSSGRRRRRRTRRTGSTTTSSRAPTPSTRTASARRRRCATASPWPPAARPSCGCASTGRRRRRRPPPSRPGRATPSTRSSPRARPTRTSSTRRSRRKAPTPSEMRILRQASAGLVWSKQMYPYNVRRWLDGDPGEPPPPDAAAARAATAGWRHLDSFDVLAMPDPWEYPWFAAWDLGFHCVPWAHLDPAFAKYQVLVLLREWFQHPNGALPAYEWNFDDVNPPVHVMAALRVFRIDGDTRPGVPRARLPEAARQLHLVGQPRGRRRQQRVQRRLPRARQHQPDRPLEPARRRRARAGRRHGVDGLLRDVDARDRYRAGARRTTSTWTW